MIGESCSEFFSKVAQNSINTFKFLVESARHYYINKTQVVNVFDREWDILIILDACRIDLIQEVSDEYEFFNDIDQIVSVGSQSEEWMKNTFIPAKSEILSDTSVVTGNPYSQTALDANQLKTLDEVWKYAWDEKIGSIRARPITDRAITQWREKKQDRLVVHYMQPHFPCILEPRLSTGPGIHDFGTDAVTIWSKLEEGELTQQEVWDAALRNLRYVLDDVEILLNNVSAPTVAITSDHGDAYGESNTYGHPRKSTLDVVKKVPWIETTAIDNQSHDPKLYKPATQSIDRNKRLQALGYK